MDEPSSRGPLTLKFLGVDDEITSDEEEENPTQTHTSVPVINTCNGNSHSLTVNNCYGKNLYIYDFISNKYLI
jgi:hypothetical protein